MLTLLSMGTAAVRIRLLGGTKYPKLEEELLTLELDRDELELERDELDELDELEELEELDGRIWVLDELEELEELDGRMRVLDELDELDELGLDELDELELLSAIVDPQILGRQTHRIFLFVPIRTSLSLHFSNLKTSTGHGRF